MAMTDIDYQIQDAIMERPVPFFIDGEVFYFFPITLGKMFIMQRIASQIGINQENLQANTPLELLRIVRKHKDSCCKLLSYMTARNEYYDIFDLPSYQKRLSKFMEQSDEDVATFLFMVLSADKTGIFIKHIGLDEEQKNFQKVMKVKAKGDKNSFSFGGLSLYGSLIDVAMERWKMTKRQVVWEIDYTSLRILMTDKVNSVFVSDEERKKIRIAKDRTKVNGDDRAAVMKIIQSESWD